MCMSINNGMRRRITLTQSSMPTRRRPNAITVHHDQRTAWQFQMQLAGDARKTRMIACGPLRRRIVVAKHSEDLATPRTQTSKDFGIADVTRVHDDVAPGGDRGDAGVDVAVRVGDQQNAPRDLFRL
jgi:hypothetical protein